METKDYGSSHDFRKSKLKFEQEKKREDRSMHGKVLRISRSVYMKLVHLNYISAFCEGKNIPLSEGFDHFIQLGIAYEQLLALQHEDRIMQKAVLISGSN